MAIDPTNFIIGTYTICLNDADIGSTTGSCTVRHTPTYLSIPSDQLAGTAKTVRTSEQLFVSLTAQEVTLDLLRLAMGYPAANLASAVLTLGYNDGCLLEENTLAIKGPGPACGCRSFEFYRAVSITESEYVLSITENTQLAMEFEILKDPSNANTFGIVTDGCVYVDAITCT
jgi:hypothetical protein